MNNPLKGIDVFLIGMMGVGKTSVGKSLSQKLSYRFFDTDILLEKVAGQSITEIFATQGEEVFRELESQVLGQLCAYTKSVISTGGGMILKQENWGYLHHGLIVWLDAPVELLVKRLATDTTRPLLKETDPTAKLSSLLATRQALYSQADLQIKIEPEQSPEQIADQILEKIPTVLKNKVYS
ncbi:MAG: shikimate kinase [Spirulinaceae cyanobacterium]